MHFYKLSITSPSEGYVQRLTPTDVHEDLFMKTLSEAGVQLSMHTALGSIPTTATAKEKI